MPSRQTPEWGDLQGAMGHAHISNAGLQQQGEDAQAKLRQAQASLGRWQQSLADLIPSPGGQLDAETVRYAPHIYGLLMVILLITEGTCSMWLHTMQRRCRGA